jgi:endo-1,4-beta-D-glucanase Y
MRLSPSRVAALFVCIQACGGSTKGESSGRHATGATAGAPATAGSSQGGSHAGPAGGAAGTNAAGSGGATSSGGRAGAGGGMLAGAGGGAGTAFAGAAGQAGNPVAGTGGASAGGGMGGQGGAGAAGAGNAGAPAATWHTAVASAITTDLLASEYANWKTKHTQTCSDGSAVVKKDEGSVVSEGIGYGLLLAVNFDDRTLFDGLWKYYLGHEDPNGLMNWSTGVCDAAGNNNAFAATDGDLDSAMALVQAAAHWPDGSYLTAAQTLTAAIAANETEVCDTRAILRPGDNFGGCSDMSSPRVNPSYFAPGYYRVFAAKFPDQAERWNALVSGSYELYPIYQARMNGLVPDWAKVDGSDWYGASYSYDACRTPWRVMVDYAWTGEPNAKTCMQGITGYTDANGIASMPNNSAFVGSFALAAAYDQTKLDAAVTNWLKGNGDDTPYFQGTLRVLYLLAAAGKFPSTL